jgi:hypothetical protein
LEGTEVPDILDYVFWNWMNSIHEQVLSHPILSLSTFDSDVLSKFNLLASKLERIACRKQANIVRNGLPKYCPLGKYLTDNS